jgi:hypothetical protein
MCCCPLASGFVTVSQERSKGDGFENATHYGISPTLFIIIIIITHHLKIGAEDGNERAKENERADEAMRGGHELVRLDP